MGLSGEMKTGPFAEFALKVVGIEAKIDQLTEYKTVADYAKAQDLGRKVDTKCPIPVQAAG
jgi:hypothetical protein